MCGEAGEGQNDGNNNAAAAQNDIEAQAFGISTGIGNPNAEVDDFDDTSNFGPDPNAEPDDFDDTTDFGKTPDDKDSFFSRFSRNLDRMKPQTPVEKGILAIAPLSKPAQLAVSLLGSLVEGTALEGESGPPDSPDSPDAPDGPGPDPKPQPELARAVRAAGVAPRVQGASRRLNPAPAPTVPAGPTQADLDRERRVQSDERRRRASRRQGRESTIVTGPLGVFGPPQLLRPRAVPGASKRLLGA